MSINQTTSEEREPVRGDATNEEFVEEQSAYLSNTQTDNSQVNHSLTSHSYNGNRHSHENPSSAAGSVSLNLDWLEGCACVRWTELFSNSVVTEYLELQSKARESRDEYPVELAGYPGLIHGNGMGSQQQTRFAFRFSLFGMTLALSFREESSRQLPNFYFKIPGEACLLHGADACLGIIRDYLDSLEGTIVDDWVRRVDIAGDFAGLDIQEWMVPAMEEKRFVTTAHYWDLPDGKQGKRSIIVGNRNRVRLSIYDKLNEMRSRGDSVKLQALIDRRWNGASPESATRVEYQLNRAWLKQFGLDRVQEVVSSIPEILLRLTEPGKGRFFAFTAHVPDRENNHQSRAGVEPRWQEIVDQMIATAGKPTGRLEPIRTGGFKLKRSWGVIKGYITSAAAQMGQECTSMAHALRIVEYLGQLNDCTDEDVAETWERKRRKLGNFDFVSPENFGDVPF